MNFQNESLQKYSLSVLLVITNCFLTLAQLAPTTQYTTSNILPHNTVRTLLQSLDGTLWIGTDNGLVEKHNTTTTTYFVEDGLPLNNIWALAEDPNQGIWVGTYGNGIAHFDGNKFTEISTEQGLINDEITHLFVFGNLLYVGTSDGVSIVTISEKEILHSAAVVGDEPMRVSGFFEFQSSVYATTYTSGIFKISTKNDKPKLDPISDHSPIYSVFKVGDSLYTSNKKTVSMVALSDLITAYPPRFKTVKNQSILWDYVETDAHTFYGAAWGIFEKNGGLYRFDKLSNASTRVSEITSNQVISLAYDKDLNYVYAGTKDAGLFQISTAPTLTFYPSPHQKMIAIAHFWDRKIQLFEDGLQVNTRSINAAFFKLKQEEYVARHTGKLPKHEDFFYELEYDTPANEIVFYGLKKAKKDFWVHTSIGMYQFHPDGTFEGYLPLHTLAFDFSTDHKLIETNPYHGVRVYTDEKELEYQYYKEALPTTPTDVVSTLQTENATYFLSVFKGLFSYDGTFKSFVHSGIWDEQKLRHSTLYKNGIAVSNEAGDVFSIVLDNGFKISEKIPRKNIEGNTISFLTAYKEWLIIATEKGITFYNGTRHVFVNDEQGIKKPIYAGSVYKDHLFLATDGGEYNVDLKRLLAPTKSIDDIYIRELKVHDGLVNTANAPLHFSASENTINIQFATNKHPYPHKLSYQYRIKKDAAWRVLETEEIQLTFLEPSPYEVQVRVQDASTGQQFEKSLLFFTIAPPFYARWWFMLSTGALLIFLTYLYFDRKKRKQDILTAKEIATNKHIEGIKTEALLAQMNPHFIFNALNSIQHLVVIEENKKAARYLHKFSKLVRANLNNAQRPFTSLQEDLDYLQTYCDIENERHGNRIAINFQVGPSIDTTDTEIPTLVLQPFLENAFVHAFPSSIKKPMLVLEATPHDEETIKYVIRDNGIGSTSFSNEVHKTSKGVYLIKQRLHFLNYDVSTCLTINYTENGTVVTLLL